MEPRSQSIRIVVIAAVRLYREGLAEVLGRCPGMEVVWADSDWVGMIRQWQDLAPDVIVLDMMLTENRDFLRERGPRPPSVPVVRIGVADSEHEIGRHPESNSARYLPRTASLDELLDAIRIAVCPESACRSNDHLAGFAPSEPNDRSRELTRREREIGSLLERDLTNKEIAICLGIEVATVKNHVHNLLEKLRVHRRVEAARLLGRTRQLAQTRNSGDW